VLGRNLLNLEQTGASRGRSITKGESVVSRLHRQGRRFAQSGRISLVLIGLVLAAGMAIGAQSAVSDQGELVAPKRFSHVNLKALGKNGLFKPASLAGDRTTSVIVKFSGKSVGEQSAGKSLSKAEKAALREQLKSQQGPVIDRIKGLGGKVYEQYQDAYNGAAVQIPLKDIGALGNVSGVEAIHPDRVVSIDNTAGVQYIGGDQAWQSTGKSGNGVKVAVIDTGIDYFHANFGGSGNANDFKNDDHTSIANGSFPTAKVAGGYDFVGDAYDASSSDPAVNTPHPDPDPADCNGHGSHTAGTAAGDGVLDNGHTYTGPYNNTTYSGHTFRIGPGVAPKATIYAYRAFGCAGSASDSVIVAALNRALTDNVDVVNMSLGSDFGRGDAPDSAASNTLAENGIVVVASSGNAGPSGYITGSPASASRVLSVAALDASSPTFPGATIALNTGKSILAQLSNGPFQNDPGASLPTGPLDVVVIRNTDGSISLGCNQADYAGAAGKLAVVVRGTCARVHKAYMGQAAGAAAVAMIDTSTNFPPFEGDVTSDPDTGQQLHLTIPFFGIRGLVGSSPPSDGDTLAAATKANSFTPTDVPNNAYQRVAGFSSAGPRNPDSALKPEITAPGVSVKSTASGTGNQGTRMSGTSMASPMTAGVAALVTEAHPAWETEAIKAALINTAEAGTGKIAAATATQPGYNVRTAGSGVVQAQRAVNTVSYVTTAGGRDTLDFGYRPISTGTFTVTLPMTIHNTSGSSITYNLSAAVNGSLGGSVSMSVEPNTVTVLGGNTATANVRATVPSAASLPGAEASVFGVIQTARGVVLATPTSTGAGIYTLRVPYVFVPRGLSNVTAGPKSAYTQSGGDLSATIPVTNSGVHSGAADVYAWGIRDANDSTGAEDSFDIRDVGVQLLPREFLCNPDPVGVCGTADDQSLVFVINNWGTASNPSVNEFDIAIDKQNDGRPDAFVVGVDVGLATTGSSDGRFASFIFDKVGNLVNAWIADAPMNGSTLELPALLSDLGLNPRSSGSEKFNYSVTAFNLVPGALVDATGVGTFRADKSPVSTGQFLGLGPGQSGTLTVTVDKGKFSGSPQLGWLVATLDDANGAAQADEIPVGDVK
jgi:minor extracellular serine protease Vpr